LGLSESESDHNLIQDAYEDRIFELTNFFMRRAFGPKLANSKIQRLASLQAIAVDLNLNKSDVNSGRRFDIRSEMNQDSMTELVLSYHKLESELKRYLVSTLDATEAIRLYERWIYLFESFADAFIGHYEQSVFALPLDEEVKLTEQIDATALIAEISDVDGPKKTLHKAYSRFKKLRS
jgi:hypothetical protein